ncbi:MAG: sigma-70 family RNA polymerase sigma factor [Ignavibacteriota bacterium]
MDLAARAGTRAALRSAAGREWTGSVPASPPAIPTPPPTADDLLQEIALSIWRGLPQFRGECSERTFLFRIAHNRAVTHLTRRRPQATAEVVDVADTAPNPEAGLAREQQGERLRSAVQALPLLYRQVVTLMLEGLDYGEIAQVLGLSESNVGARLSRARQMLREAMEVKR